MVKIETFAVEHVRLRLPDKTSSLLTKTAQWFDTHENDAKYNIAETCSSSLSVEDLQALSEDKTSPVVSLSTRLVYGPIRGSERLRFNLASLYSAKGSPLPSSQILITPGAIMANYLSLYTLVGPGDHVVCHYPTYQQLYSVPASLGAEVSLWRAKEQQKWQLDISELRNLVRPNTKMLIINNPNNPTGAIIPRPTLEEIVDFAREHNLIVLSDEVYRPMFHSIGPGSGDFPPSMINMGYPRVVVTGSLSKAYALAGIRVGWIASRDPEIIEQLAAAREYTTISVSQIDDQIATYALDHSCVHALLARNIQLAKRNLSILEDFIEQHRWACSWVRPVAGTTAFVKFNKMGKPIDDVEFCERLQNKTGVFFAPGCRCFGGDIDFKGYVRIGFVCETDVLVQGLDALRGFMEDEYENVPVAKK